ncbi:MAG: DNA mismatch repair endonuclease MutL, partial [Chloroflexi bacterium]|nr:DNA mismatch repair endonuclease MutL [Chloroflexota bacterium]
MTIKILPEALAAQIAAGEVIERPASVVKELIENAIDAGASEIRVEMRDGGKRLLRVSDNGSGIPSGEVELAFSHHATSKLNSVDDLFRITTLGFRGEALPSIAAVSQLAMLTRSADEPAGVELRLHGGRVTQREAHAAPRGTVITVENLFYNVPARLKFMKSSGSESGHINELVSRYALAYPAIRFSLTSESRLVFQSPGSGSMADVLVAVYGADTARQMVEVSAERSDAGEPGGQGRATAAVYGYLSNPALNRANRAHMVFFVNGRLVQDRSLTFSVVEAYHTLLQVGRFPLCVLKVSVPADEVDVNVHPSKAEVKFRHPGFVFSAVQRAVRATVIGQTPIPALSLPDGADRQGEAPRLSFGQLGLEVQRTAAPLSPPDADDRLHGREWLYPPADREPESGTSRPDVPPDERDAPLPILRVLGQVARTYIIAEGPEGIFLIDQHAAHERILYEKFRRERQALGASAQSLLEPLAVDLTPRQAVRLADRMA